MRFISWDSVSAPFSAPQRIKQSRSWDALCTNLGSSIIILMRLERRLSITTLRRSTLWVMYMIQLSGCTATIELMRSQTYKDRTYATSGNQVMMKTQFERIETRQCQCLGGGWRIQVRTWDGVAKERKPSP